jgi:predicted Ser/Thr protein kinase
MTKAKGYLPVSMTKRIEAVCARFLADWTAGSRPDMEKHLGSATGREREELLRALLRIELEFLPSTKLQTCQPSYEARFPGEAGVVQEVFREFQSRAVKTRPAPTPATLITQESVSVGQAGTKGTSSLGTPRTIGRFQIRALVGEGAFGRVFLAYDPQLDRQVAIKVPREGVLASPEEIERFLREARAAATLQHPNVCPMHEVGQENQTYYLVMAYVEGKTLAEHLKERKEPFPARQIAFILRKLALALSVAHSKGVIHRDLKPANIMIDRERKDVVIMDFGLARRLKSNDARQTGQGLILGTPAYMAPEQARGDNLAVGPASDIYSLGVILYELLTGRLPFTGSPAEVIGQLQHVEPPPPSCFCPAVDPRLEAVCLKAMSKKPADRYPSMKALAEALNDFLRASPQKAIVSQRRHSAEKPGTLPLEEVVKVVRAERSQETHAAIEEAVRRSRIPLWKWLAGAGLLAALIWIGLFFFHPTTTVTVLLQLDVNLSDPSLRFLLDRKDISADALRVPVELAVGDHELDVERGGILYQRYRFRVNAHMEPQIRLQPVEEKADALPASPRIRLLVPAYFYPGREGLQDWEKLLQASRLVEIVAVVNPSSGPGKARDPNYTSMVRRAARAKVIAIGYVDTHYAERPLADVRADVNRWVEFYPEIGGFFFDRQARDASKVEYYLELAQHARQSRPQALVVTNPGTPCAPEYIARSATDVVCMTESIQNRDGWVVKWTGNEASHRCAAVLYEIEQPEQMRQIARDMAAKQFGYLYLTNGKGQNPWAQLPTWWEEELVTIRDLNQSRGQ